MTTENYNDNNDLDFIDKNDKESPTSEISSIMTGITENITPIGLLALLTLVIYLAQKDNESNENKNLGNNNTDNKNLGNNNTDNKNLGNNNTDKKIAQKDNAVKNPGATTDMLTKGLNMLTKGLNMLNESVNKSNAVKNPGATTDMLNNMQFAKHTMNYIKSSNNDMSNAVELQNQDLNKGENEKDQIKENLSRNLADYIQGKKEAYVKRMKEKEIKERKKVIFADPIEENANKEKSQDVNNGKNEKDQIEENLSRNLADYIQGKKEESYVKRMKAKQIQIKERKKVDYFADPIPIEENANKEKSQDVNNGKNEKGSDKENLSYNLTDYVKQNVKKNPKKKRKANMMDVGDVRTDNM